MSVSANTATLLKAQHFLKSSLFLSAAGDLGAVMSQTWCEGLFYQMKRSILGAFSLFFLLETHCPAKLINFPHCFVSVKFLPLTEMLPWETLNYVWISVQSHHATVVSSSQHLVQNYDGLQNACLMLILISQLWTCLKTPLPLPSLLNFMMW